MDENRRRFLKQAGVAGAVAWTAPVITTAARAQTGGTPACGCGGRAYGVSVVQGALDEIYGDTGPQTASNLTCLSPVNDTVEGSDNVRVTATDACGETVFDSACAAEGSVASFSIDFAPSTDTILSATQPLSALLTSSCDCAATPPVTYTGVPSGTAITAKKDQTTATPVDFVANGSANQQVGPTNIGSSTNVTVFFNERTQECRSDVLYHIANAARVVITKGSDTSTVILGHAEVSSGCACPIP